MNSFFLSFGLELFLLFCRKYLLFLRQNNCFNCNTASDFKLVQFIGLNTISSGIIPKRLDYIMTINCVAKRVTICNKKNIGKGTVHLTFFNNRTPEKRLSFAFQKQLPEFGAPIHLLFELYTLFAR